MEKPKMSSQMIEFTKARDYLAGKVVLCARCHSSRNGKRRKVEDCEGCAKALEHVKLVAEWFKFTGELD